MTYSTEFRSEKVRASASYAGVPLATALREATRALHERAERSGVIVQIMRGSASVRAYALLLRNLLPVYQALEDGLERHRSAPGVRLVVRPTLYRAPAIAHDLAALGLSPAEITLLPEGAAYAQRIAEITQSAPARLIGHAYTRYLGDLSGGQILRRILSRSLGLAPDALTLYRFPTITDPQAYKAEYRLALTQAAHETEAGPIIDEALNAFRLTIALSSAVDAEMPALDSAAHARKRPILS